MEILDGIHKVDGVNCNCYLVKGQKGCWTLIDAGMPGNAKKILSYMSGTLKCRPSDLKTIIITHGHIDHIGSLAAMKEATGAKVAAHGADADFIAGKKEMSVGKNISWKIRIFRLLSPFMKATPVQPDILLSGNDKIAGMEVIHAPGHTPGSICLYDKKRHVLFVGDLVRFLGGKVVGPPITLDEEQVRESVVRVSKLEFKVMLSGHGEPLMSHAAERVREFHRSEK